MEASRISLTSAIAVALVSTLCLSCGTHRGMVTIPAGPSHIVPQPGKVQPRWTSENRP